MKFACSLLGVSPRYYGPVAQAAEAAGFESILASEHVVFPEVLPNTYPDTQDGVSPFPPGTPLYDPWLSLAYIACATTTLRLGTLVSILPLHHPIVTARAVATLDRLSGGRVTLAVGVGWLEDEFTILGRPFRTRGKQTDEIIGLLRRLWSEEVIAHDGEFFRFPAVRFEPKPLQRPFPPIEIGGHSPAALRRAGWLGDGWVASGNRSTAELEACIAIVEKHRRDSGRNGLPFEITASVGTDVAAIQRARDAGVSRVVVIFDVPGRGATPETYRDFLERFDDQVMAKV
jgi:probable F420-dependent oxidoreductase